jgi:general secretion pathway protein H
VLFSLKRQRGFTLVEILVVAFVIAILVSMVSFAMPSMDANSELKKHADSFHKELIYVSEQAVLKGEIYAMFLEQDQAENESGLLVNIWCYQWQRVRDGFWEPVPELAQRKCLHPSIDWDVSLNGKKWVYDPELDIQEPVLGFFPSGDATGDTEMFLTIDSFKAGPAMLMTQPMPPGSGDEHFWVSLLGEIHWISEEKRLGIDTRIEHNKRWFR